MHSFQGRDAHTIPISTTTTNTNINTNTSGTTKPGQPNSTYSHSASTTAPVEPPRVWWIPQTVTSCGWSGWC